MAEFKISRFRYTWRGDWVTGTVYTRDDVVRYGGSSFVCFRGHTAASSFYTDLNYTVPGSSPTVASPAWVVMTEGSSWRGDWQNGAVYNTGDIAYYAGTTYLCTVPHTAGGAFSTNEAKWTIYAVSKNWANSWAPTTSYGPGDLVRYAGNLYECVKAHTSGTRLDSGSNHLHIHGTVVAGDVDYVTFTVGSTPITSLYLTKYVSTDLKAFFAIQVGSTWTAGVDVDQMLAYGHLGPGTPGLQVGDNILQPMSAVLSANTTYTMWIQQTGSILTEYVISTDQSYTASGLSRPADYSGDTANPTAIGFTTTFWKTYYEGVDAYNTWTSLSSYGVNTLVKYGGSIWRCTTGHAGELTFNTDYWTIELYGYQFGNDWATNTTYQIGDIVRYGGDLYYATENNLSNSVTPATEDSTIWIKLAQGYNTRGLWDSTQAYRTGDLVQRGGDVWVCVKDVGVDGSTFDYLDPDYWELVVPGIRWRGHWSSDTVHYSVNDLVIYQGDTYKCALPHVSTETTFPGDNGSVIGLWDLYLLGGDTNGMINRGDLASYNLSRAASGDQSTISETNVAIGEEDQILMVDNNSSLYYKKYGAVQLSRWVSPNGVDRPDYGNTPFLPYKTIRYACEQVETVGGNVKIAVLPGVYEEVLPIIVPAGVAIKGEEVRAVTVRPKAANPALANDAIYTIAVLNHLSSLIDSVVQGNEISPTIGNDETQNMTATGSLGASVLVLSLITDVINYINFYVRSVGGIDPTVTGTNTATNNAGVIGAITALENNKEFLAAEAVAWMQLNNSTYDFDPESCKRDIRRYIDAWQYDLRYTGNYKTVLSARYYSNAVLGSEREDMFYVRDATGIRNMTLSGLTGTVTPIGVFEFYQRPTGGSYVSLDPGWGPNDDRTWITTRSCYVQNVTTFGYACTGQKIDGAIHNGGNKSIVSNDFTQIISDGIGAHVLNGGRAELVSVFTYYSQVGYLTENGGIIRATNGNSSYGTYGVMSLGIDESEVPRNALINNRNNQATVQSVMTDENDHILVAEYANAGQNYTAAAFTVTGSGLNAVLLQEDIRDQAVFEATPVNPFDSGAPGGGGHTFVQGNAQSGTTTTIKISPTDSNTEEAYLGLRLIIISGVGAGQYGYISAYNPVTKTISMRKESTGEPGWDHVVPGTIIKDVLLPSSRYNIEPRPIFSAPEYSATSVNLPVNTTWNDIVFGETYQVFNNQTGDAGAGTTDPTVVPVTAIWDVVKNGRTYTVTLDNPGAGYEAGQEVRILGSALGGVAGDNDVVITILAVSDDSTNSITSWRYRGIGASGKFVVTSTNDAAAYSADGTTWTATTMPSSGDWRCLAANNSRFVAIRYNSNVAAYSDDGVNWAASAMPLTREWTSAAYGGGKFVAVSSSGNSAAYSNNGVTWVGTSMSAGDSTFNQWVDVCYGAGKFFAISNSGNAGSYSTDGITWTSTIVDATLDSSQVDWVSCAYGLGRYVAISSQGVVGYSFDLDKWYPATLPTQDGSTLHNWKEIRYGHGVFFAVGDTGSRTVGNDPTTGPTTFAATSQDGVNWTAVTLATERSWSRVAFGNPNVNLGDSTVAENTGTWVAINSDSGIFANKIYTGARALGRVLISSGRISKVKLWNPGSGYTVSPTLTLVDPNNTSELYTNNRIASGVLGQPTFLNSGIGYLTDSTTVTVMGDGFADIIPTGKFITLSNISVYPGPGAQLTFTGNNLIYTAVIVTPLGDLGDGNLSALIQVSPSLGIDDYLEHDTYVEIREKYSQCRVTGHDFLDVGTGNFIETNYPTIYATGQYTPASENEVVEEQGGRVFYTSTDQDGNFRTGELFAVEQATGIVTISADFFDLGGLTELKLGGVRLGGSGVVVREFSTDPLFVEDSNNIVPTQRAVKAYLASKLAVSGADLVANAFTAGEIEVSGESNTVRNVLDKTIVVPVRVDFKGPLAGATGRMMATAMFYRSFRDDE